MAFELCLDACCIDCEGLCDDVDKIAFLVTLSGFADATAVPDPPGLGTCEVCDDLNQTYVLTFSAAGDPGAPFPPCTTTDENFAILPCFYMTSYGCSSDSAEGTFGRTIFITLRAYVTNSGDRRGYLQVAYGASYLNKSTSITTTRSHTYAHDFLIQSGSASTNCLDFTLSDSLDLVCADSAGSIGIDCTPPTNFDISVVAA